MNKKNTEINKYETRLSFQMPSNYPGEVFERIFCFFFLSYE